MNYLALSVLFTCLIFTLLKEIERFKLHIFQTIWLNYLVSAIIGFTIMPPSVPVEEYVLNDWFLGTVIVSFIFVVTFNIMAATAQKIGLSVMTIAAKMSMMIPILVGILLYKEQLGVLKVMAIVLTFGGVFLTVYKGGSQKGNAKLWLLPASIFFLGGFADSILNHMQIHFLEDHEMGMLTTLLFAFCFVISTVYFIINLILGKMKIHLKSWLGGIVLGLPNYFSIYYLLKALSNSGMPTSLVFTINNLLVVFISALIAVVIYKEKMSKLNYVGVITSLLAISIFYFTL